MDNHERNTRDDQTDRLRRKFAREKRARELAEQLLEQKAGDLYRLNNSLLREKEFIRRTLSAIKEAVIGIDLQGNLVFLNGAAEKLCAGKERAINGQPLCDYLEFFSPVPGQENSLLNINKPLPDEALVVNKLGQTATVELSSICLYDLENNQSGTVIALRDITETQDVLKRLNRLSKYDPMTSLPNRRHFFEILDSQLNYAGKNNRRFAVIVIDVNNFKRINEWMGQEQGDTAIQNIAEVLSRHVKTPNLVFRLNGDEFAVLMTDVKKTSEPVSFAGALVDQLNAIELSLSDKLFLSCAAGVSLFPDHGDDTNTLLHAADAARKRAKLNDNQKVALFDKTLSTEYAQQVEIEKMLSTEVYENALFVALQPKWNIKTRQITGAELLLRCELPICGRVPPTRVISIAEDINQICKLGWWIIEKACHAINKLQQEGVSIPIAINLSALQLKQPRFIERLLNTLRAEEISPSSLVLELTESVMLQDPNQSQALLNQLNREGFAISIDDFGTGYSSLAYLQHLNVQELKIDKTFVDNLNDGSGQTAIIKAILALATALDLTVVAEGIENEEQRQQLIELGCESGQGYLVSRPLPVDEFLALMSKAEPVSHC